MTDEDFDHDESDDGHLSHEERQILRELEEERLAGRTLDDWWADARDEGRDPLGAVGRAFDLIERVVHNRGRLLEYLVDLEALSQDWTKAEVTCGAQYANDLRRLADQTDRFRCSRFGLQFTAAADPLIPQLRGLADEVIKACDEWKAAGPRRDRQIAALTRWVENHGQARGSVGKGKAQEALATLIQFVTGTKRTPGAQRMLVHRIKKANPIPKGPPKRTRDNKKPSGGRWEADPGRKAEKAAKQAKKLFGAGYQVRRGRMR